MKSDDPLSIGKAACAKDKDNSEGRKVHLVDDVVVAKGNTVHAERNDVVANRGLKICPDNVEKVGVIGTSPGL